MPKLTLKVVLSLALAVALVFVTAPVAGAISYYAYLQQYLNQTQAPAPSPEPTQPTPQPSRPTQPSTALDFWNSRTAARNALLGLQPTRPDPEPKPTQPIPTPSPAGISAREQQMLTLINQDRVSHGLQPLLIDPELCELARLKSQDIVALNYFAHQSPTYGTVFDMLRARGIGFLRGGENLSKASNVPVSHLRLMNSTNHRANLLTPQYTHIGIGIVDNNPTGIVVTEIFIQKP